MTRLNTLSAPLVVAILVTAGASACRAGLDPGVEATEVMMQSQGLQAILIGSNLGPDGAATLEFVSSVDATAKTFSYSLAAGSAYQGQPVSWETAGAFNPARASGSGPRPA